MNILHKLSLLGALALVGCQQPNPSANNPNRYDEELRQLFDRSVRYTDRIEFPQLQRGDVIKGRALFGLSPDGTQIDTTQALFEGNSVIAGEVKSNGTACSHCHRPEANLMMPLPPLSKSGLPADDPLFTGRNAEAQDDPRQDELFEKFGLMKQRPGRFNPLREQSDPFRQIFSWRKSQTILNMAFSYGLLTDGRLRHAIEQARGAIFTHTQDFDTRFDDLANPHLHDIAAYMQSEIFPPELGALLDPQDPDHERLKNEPFATVPVKTALEAEGQKVFIQYCFSCHNMPNVFSNRDHQDGPPANYPLLYGHTFDVGVSQRNALNLDYRYYNAQTGQYSTLIVPLVTLDGRTVMWPVTTDIGAAAASGRYEDLHRFKVPQLRSIAKLAPYFHDNSAFTLEEVVDFFNSEAYNTSADGKRYPINMNAQEREALLAFLRIL